MSTAGRTAANWEWTLCAVDPCQTSEAPPSGQPRRRLLVVDDEPAMCEILALYFESKGLEVTTAQTASQGTCFIEDNDFDLAILDWKLDGQPRGLDLLELSRATHPQMPVIIFTGAEDTVSLGRQLAGRAAAVMAKGGSLTGLSAEVEKHVKW